MIIKNTISFIEWVCFVLLIIAVIPVCIGYAGRGLVESGWWGFGLVVVGVIGLLKYNKEKNE